MKLIYELKYMNASIYIGDAYYTGDEAKDIFEDVKSKGLSSFNTVEVLCFAAESECEKVKGKHLEEKRPLINYNSGSVFDWFLQEYHKKDSYVFKQIERFKNGEFE